MKKSTKRKMSAARKQWWKKQSEEQKVALRLKIRKAKREAWERLSEKEKNRVRRSMKNVRELRVLTSVEVPCEQCGKLALKNPYIIKKSKNLFCSRECAVKHRAATRKANTVKCKNCDTEFNRVPSREKLNNGNHFCCRECMGKYRSGENHHAWIGGRTPRSDGYVDVRIGQYPEKFKSMARKDGRVMEHRIVMAVHVDRPLEPHEVVHHKNGIRNDNRVSNLEIHSSFGHNGITASDNREIARLRRELKKTQKQLSKLVNKTKS